MAGSHWLRLVVCKAPCHWPITSALRCSGASSDGTVAAHTSLSLHLRAWLSEPCTSDACGCSPFWDKRVNVLDCFCCLGILCHLVAGLYYNNKPFIADKDGKPSLGADALDRVLVAVNSLLIAAMLALFATTFSENRLRSYSTSRLSKRVADVFIKFQTELRRNRDQFAQVMQCSHWVLLA